MRRLAVPVVLVAAAIATVAASWSSSGAPERTPATPSAGEDVLRVETFNLNFGISGDPDTLAGVGLGHADVVALEEVTDGWVRSIRTNYADDYPVMAFQTDTAAGGLGLLSRYPIDGPDELPPPPGGWFPAWRAVVHAPLGDVQLLVVHLRPPASDSGSFVTGHFTTPSVREDEIRAYLAALDPGMPTLVLGDFNEDDGGRGARELLDAGFRSALPEFHPDARTWRWPVGPFTLRGQLDHVDYRGLVPLDCDVLDVGRSDHLPVVATFVRR